MKKTLLNIIIFLIPFAMSAQWTETSTGTIKSIWDIQQLSVDTLIAVGGYGTVLKSVDNGQNWEAKMTPVPWQLLSVDFKDNNTGIAVGEFKNILRTTNGGESWSVMVQTDNTWLTDVKFVNDTTLITAGHNGVLWRSVDEGSSWPDSISPDSTITYRDIWVFNDTSVMVVGENGSIFFSQNIGNSWQDYSLSVSTQIRSVHFISNTDGFIVGDAGLVMKTTDGGINWTSITIGTSVELLDINFHDLMSGFIVGNGVIYRTNDGGSTWFAQYYNSNMMTSVLFVDSDTVLVSGVEGTILKNTNASVVGINEALSENQLSYYYSSAQKALHLSGLNPKNQYRLNVVDALGQHIINSPLTVESSIVNLSNTAAGIYIFTVYSNEEIYSGKIIK
ncbi:MAG: T9SS type A sorting domain-containing protein [Flavobacteriales bacterium]|nr:T9SS type A sorting domain-containing protein [Flavobacteriales bacterium]